MISKLLPILLFVVPTYGANLSEDFWNFSFCNLALNKKISFFDDKDGQPMGLMLSDKQDGYFVLTKNGHLFFPLDKSQLKMNESYQFKVDGKGPYYFIIREDLSAGSVPRDYVKDSSQYKKISLTSTYRSPVEPIYVPGLNSENKPGVYVYDYPRVYFFEGSGQMKLQLEGRQTKYVNRTNGHTLDLSDNAQNGVTYAEPKAKDDFSEKSINRLHTHVTLSWSDKNDSIRYKYEKRHTLPAVPGETRDPRMFPFDRSYSQKEVESINSCPSCAGICGVGAKPKVNPADGSGGPNEPLRSAQ